MIRKGALMPAATVARRLGMHRSTVVRWVATGKLAGVCVPRRVRPGQRRRWYVYRSAYQLLLGDHVTPGDGQ
jgi:excisionase family DNA binding protein